VKASTAIGLVLALASTTLTNLAYLREHDAAAALPCLTLRRPLRSAHLLLTDRSWMVGFALEGGGFLLYAVALGLASLALVQSVGAGGIGLLAFASSRIARRPLGFRERAGVLLAVVGLIALAISLSGASGEGTGGSTITILIWICASAGCAALVLTLGRHLLGAAIANGLAGGLFFSIGDFSTKLVTQGGTHTAFLVTVVLGYLLGTSLLQVGYQSGGALTVAGLATLLTNAVPIAAGTIVLHEPVPSGASGGLRILAFAAVSAGAVLLAKPEHPAGTRTPRGGHEAVSQQPSAAG
jgi:hypothetical protein